MKETQPITNGRRGQRLAPAARHLALLVVTYAALSYVFVVAQRVFPPLPTTASEALSLQAVLRAGGAMLGALALAFPVAWVFLITRRRRGYSQSVVHTLIVLPLAVAGIMTLVQDSLPLAFGLAGIAFLRFRNNLDDTKDAVYLFVATGIGIAAASGQFAVGLALSFLFNVTIIILWWTDFARLPARLKARLTMKRLRQTLEQRLPRADGLRPAPDARNAALRIHAADVSSAQPMAEAVLQDVTKRWELTGVTPGEHGFSTLDYVVRLRRSTERGALLNDLRARGTPHIVGAEYR